MSYKVLTPEQVEQFMELGWVKVEQAYPREQALACQQFLWGKLQERGVEKEDPSTWKPMVSIQEAYRSQEFDECNTQRMIDAIEDLIGEGRWTERSVYGVDQNFPTWGWWPVNFSLGSDQEWDVPTEGWHWDGQHFRHYVDSPEQGLLCLCIFSDIESRGGGTLVAEGSHKLVARFLNRFPDGTDQGWAIGTLNREHPWLSELTGNSKSDDGLSRMERFMNPYTDEDGTVLRIVETQAKAGDVILCHPFLYHAPSQNHKHFPRFMCNRTTPLKERMNFRREPSDSHSPLEKSIRRAIGLE